MAGRRFKMRTDDVASISDADRSEFNHWLLLTSRGKIEIYARAARRKARTKCAGGRRPDCGMPITKGHCMAAAAVQQHQCDDLV